MNEKHSSSGAVSKRKRTTLQIPETMIHTVLKSAQEIETKAPSLLTHSEVKIPCQRSNVMKIMERCLATWIKDL
jgi:hypothetical protein